MYSFLNLMLQQIVSTILNRFHSLYLAQHNIPLESSIFAVQVMIAAAARQLVAGSKWITKEATDSKRIGRLDGVFSLRRSCCMLPDL